MTTVSPLATAGVDWGDNDPPPRPAVDEFADNQPLVDAVVTFGAAWANNHLSAVGETVGHPDFRDLADRTHMQPPMLDNDATLHPRVVYNAAYHEVMATATRAGTHALSWTHSRAGAHVARATAFMLLGQVEPGHGCPISMTHAAVPALRVEPVLGDQWIPRLTRHAYQWPPSTDAAAPALCGMTLTERQGGSDLRANRTVATPVGRGGRGQEHRIDGAKWFCSAPESDLFLITAQTGQGLGCFAVPRLLPDGTRNGMRIVALKDKLGNRSNASAQITLEAASGWLIGAPDAGLGTILKMVEHARLDCVHGTTAGMRDAIVRATWYAAHRHAFNRRLADQPAMEAVLADLCVETEAAAWTSLRLARAMDTDASDHDTALRRVMIPAAKFWVCRRGPEHAFEAMECLGGNGYVEDYTAARRYREQPLMSIWEGSGNVIALDVLRALANPSVRAAAQRDLWAVRGQHDDYDQHLTDLEALLHTSPNQDHARRLTEMLATAWQARLLLEHAPEYVADAYCRSRLGSGRRLGYGSTPIRAAAQLIARHQPIMRA